jgi:hypothetical protein
MRAILAPVGVAAALVAIAGGCGGDDAGGTAPEPEAAGTRFHAALETIGGGGGPIGAGYGWIDLDALRDAPGGLDANLSWAASALGPGADDIARGSGAIARAGIDVSRAHDMVATAGSYAFGVRVDGVQPATLRNEYEDADAEESSTPGWTTYDLGPEKTVALGTPMEAFAALGSRTAASDDGVALARSDDGRADVIGVGESVATAPELVAESNCLGDVDAARVLPNNFTHLSGIGPDLIGVGVGRRDDGSVHEILCLVDPSEDEITSAAAALEKAFTGDAIDPLSGRLMTRSVASAEVSVEDSGDLDVARADLMLEQDARPGVLFSALLTGSLVTFEGLAPPIPADLNLSHHGGRSG